MEAEGTTVIGSDKNAVLAMLGNIIRYAVLDERGPTGGRLFRRLGRHFERHMEERRRILF
jgi:hypothetical protein